MPADIELTTATDQVLRNIRKDLGVEQDQNANIFLSVVDYEGSKEVYWAPANLRFAKLNMPDNSRVFLYVDDDCVGDFSLLVVNGEGGSAINKLVVEGNIEMRITGAPTYGTYDRNLYKFSAFGDSTSLIITPEGHP